MADIDQSTVAVDDEDLDYHPFDSLESIDKGGDEASDVTNEEISDEPKLAIVMCQECIRATNSSRTDDGQ